MRERGYGNSVVLSTDFNSVDRLSSFSMRYQMTTIKIKTIPTNTPPYYTQSN